MDFAEKNGTNITVAGDMDEGAQIASKMVNEWLNWNLIIIITKMNELVLKILKWINSFLDILFLLHFFIIFVF